MAGTCLAVDNWVVDTVAETAMERVADANDGGVRTAKRCPAGLHGTARGATLIGLQTNAGAD